MMKETWLEKNPMLIEVRIAARKFLPKGWHKNAKILILCCGLILIGIIMLGVYYADIIPAQAFCMAAVGISGLTMLVSSPQLIAGERQNRSLEPLLAAPVTSTQIVLGKVARAWLAPLAALVICFGAGWLIYLGGLFNYKVDFHQFTPFPLYFLITLLLGIVTNLGILGLTLAISAHLKNTTSASLSAFLTFIALFAILPSVLYPILENELPHGEAIPFTHPLVATILTSNLVSNHGVSEGEAALAIAIGNAIFIGIFLLGIHLAIRKLERIRSKGEDDN